MRTIICFFAFSLLFVGPQTFTQGSPVTESGIIIISCDPQVRRCD